MLFFCLAQLLEARCKRSESPRAELPRPHHPLPFLFFYSTEKKRKRKKSETGLPDAEYEESKLDINMQNYKKL